MSWAGLRGAVPIVLATIPLTAGHPDGSLVFNVVFVTVLARSIIQAGTVGLLVKRLGFAEDGLARTPRSRCSTASSLTSSRCA